MKGFISIKELQNASGYTNNKAICEWLEEIGIKPVTGKNGIPVVTWDAFNQVYKGNSSNEPDYTRVA